MDDETSFEDLHESNQNSEEIQVSEATVEKEDGEVIDLFEDAIQEEIATAQEEELFSAEVIEVSNSEVSEIESDLPILNEEEVISEEKVEEIVKTEEEKSTVTKKWRKGHCKKHKRKGCVIARKIAVNALNNSVHNITIFKDSLQNIKKKYKKVAKANKATEKVKKTYKQQLVKKIQVIRNKWAKLSNVERKLKAKVAGRVIKQVKAEFRKLDDSTKKLIMANKQLFFGELLININEQSQMYLKINAPAAIDDLSKAAA